MLKGVGSTSETSFRSIYLYPLIYIKHNVSYTIYKPRHMLFYRFFFGRNAGFRLDPSYKLFNFPNIGTNFYKIGTFM